MSLSQQTLSSISNFSFSVGFSCAFIGGLIQAIVSNYCIEPRIEKRLGVKLQYMSIWSSLPLFGYFLCRNTELLLYIVPAYFRWKWKDDTSALELQWLCLYKANYRIEDASKSEIIFAYIASINAFVALSGVIVGILMH